MLSEVLDVQLDVKFRAFGIDFGHVSVHKQIPLPTPLPPAQILSYNDHGVKLVLTLKPAVSPGG